MKILFDLLILRILYTRL